MTEQTPVEQINAYMREETRLLRQAVAIRNQKATLVSQLSQLRSQEKSTDDHLKVVQATISGIDLGIKHETAIAKARDAATDFE